MSYPVLSTPSNRCGEGTTVRFEGSDTRYEQIAADLTRKIHGGVIKARQRLPSEPDLAREYCVSRVTIRAAIAILKRRGLVTQRRGVGTFASGIKVRQEIAKLGDFYEAMVAQGVHPHVTLLDFRIIDTDPFVAGVLRQERAMLLVREYRVDGDPIAVTQAFLHPDASHVSWNDAEQHSVVHIIEAVMALEIETADLKIRVETGGPQARQLGLQPHEPMLVLERVSLDKSGMPLEFTSWFLRADAYEFGMNLHGPFHLADGFLRPLARATAL